MNHAFKEIRHIGIWGRTRSGKSTRAREIIKGRERVVIFDVQGEFGDVANDNVSTIPDLVRAVGRRSGGPFVIAYVPTRGALPEQLDTVSDALIRLQAIEREGRQRQLTFYVEEMASGFPNKQNVAPCFQELCNQGSHSGVNLIGVSQRMAQVSMAFRGQTVEDYFFPLRANVDYVAATELMGKQWEADLRSLKPHECLKFAEGQVEKQKNSL